MIGSNLVEILYILASILFIFGLKMLGKADTAPKGNMISAIGMLIAILTAVLSKSNVNYALIGLAILLGSIVGAFASKRVQMTAMPELVALFNGFGGLASLLVGLAEYEKYYAEGTVASQSPFAMMIIAFTIIVGAITFTGSVIAWAKLARKISSKAILFTGLKTISIFLSLIIVLTTVFFSFSPDLLGGTSILVKAIIISALVFGVLFVIPIGGGDMPVVISLLNSFSGVAALLAGFVIYNDVLIVAGALVGSSGLILTSIMTRAMNRNLKNVLFSSFAKKKERTGIEIDGEPNPVNVEDAYLMLEAADSVMVVPGYGMAVAQAQHLVYELAKELEKNGTEVDFAIHPVAGRMPGHMNVLLAEANVSYDKLKEMDDVNPIMETVDVAIVIGANDVVNPAANKDEGSPIYGMPVINVDKARNVIVFKRSMNTGFAGIQNPLFFNDNTRMLFGDAKKTVGELVAQFKE